MPNELGVSLILNFLNKDYDQFIQNYNMHSMGKSIVELLAMIKLHEKGIPKKVETPAVLAIREEVGYWKRNFLSYQAELKKRKNASIASTSELYDFPNKTWVYDTGCGTHICNTLQGLRGSRKLKHEALSLYMGNGMRAAVEAIGGGEYLSHEFVNHMKSYGIVSQLTPPYTPQHNRVSERRNRTLLDMVRSMMNLTTLPKSFWGYALESAVRILNMVPTKKVERTPYEIWHGAPKLSYLWV
ncbi:zinc finger, CCHC-type containing protein [Tanacetum coccineum]